MCGQIDENYSTIIKSYYCDINKRPDKTKNKVNNDLSMSFLFVVVLTFANVKRRFLSFISPPFLHLLLSGEYAVNSGVSARADDFEYEVKSVVDDDFAIDI